MDHDLTSLLKLADLIQIRIKQEAEPNVRKSLEHDLVLVKTQIGKRVLELPPDVELFSKPKYDEISEDSGILTIPLDSPPRDRVVSPATDVSGGSSSELPGSNIETKFAAFMTSKQTPKPKHEAESGPKRQTKSKIPRLG
jgi:hypothetical protein